MTFAMLFSLVAVFTVSADEVAFDIIPYGSGFENWENSTNKGDEEAVVQMLVCPKINDVKVAELYATDIDWTFTITGDDGSSKTITLKQSSQYDGGTWGIVRFEPVLADQANQFIPVPGVSYAISATVVAGGTTYVGTSTKDYVWPEDDKFGDPIVPDAYVYPEVPVEPAVKEITISPYNPDALKGFENWSGQTQLLICTTESVPADYTWELTITDGTTTKTITAKASSEYDTWLDRFEVCTFEGENQFVPVVGTEYTISANIYDAEGNLAFVAPAASGFVCSQDPIVPEPPVVEPPVVDPVDPPATGDATVYAIVFAIVSILGMGVVVTKKVRA
jgi:hypothetical protein